MAMDIESLTWSVRQLNDRVSDIYLDEYLIVVGGWDGTLSCWDLDGQQKWSVKLSSRIQSICRHESVIYVAAGLNAVALNIDSGETLWSQATEGSADAIMCSSDGKLIVAISSVYDIEYGDFMESACWQYDMSGDLLTVERMDERPWHSHLHEGKITLGLGRPRGGYLTIDGKDSNWSKILDDDPITCGVSNSHFTIFGHAKGGLTCLRNGEVEHLPALEAGVENVSLYEKGILLTLDSGKTLVLDKSGLPLSSIGIENSAISIHSGLFIESEQTIWQLYYENEQCLLSMLTLSANKPHLNTAVGSLVTAFNSTSTHTALGCEDGRIMVFESELLQRRLTTSLQIDESPKPLSDAEQLAKDDAGTEHSDANTDALERRRKMQAKLRKLREK